MQTILMHHIGFHGGLFGIFILPSADKVIARSRQVGQDVLAAIVLAMSGCINM
jgi:hypothetical protein